MKGALGFDPKQHDSGPTTAGVRQILAEWESIDWFVPPHHSRQVGHELFIVHNALASAYAPTLFPATVMLQPATGGWPEFVALCKRVRANQEWSWKYSVLKTLSNLHSKAHGWSLDAQAQHGETRLPYPGELFFRIGKHVMWGDLNVELDYSTLSPEESEHAGFFVSYCYMDVINSLEWQLAENHSDLSRNPFVPLVRCYAAGLYPFSFGPASIVMFAFTKPS